MNRKVLWQGNEAIAEGAIYAGCNFFAGYPITPSSEIAESLSEMLPTIGGKFIQMEDEIAAMGAVIGASLAGAKALTATSGPGFSLKLENLGYACMTEIPCVVVNVMRGGPSTGAPTGPSQSDIMQARWGTHGDHPVIALAPSTVKEHFTETVRAFNLSEMFRTPVIILSDEIVGHMREMMVVPAPGELELIERKKPTVPPSEYLPYDDSSGMVPPMANFGDGYRYHVTGLNHDQTGFPTQDAKIVQSFQERTVNKVLKNIDKISSYEEEHIDSAEIVLVSFGSSARSAKVAYKKLRENGKKVGYLKLKTLWPFPDDLFKTLANKVDKAVVIEMNLGQLIFEVERFFGLDRVHGVFRADCEPITPNQIIKAIEEL